MRLAPAKDYYLQASHKLFFSEPARRCQCIKHLDTSSPLRRISPGVINLQTPVNLRALRSFEFSPTLSPGARSSSVASVTSVAEIYYFYRKDRKEHFPKRLPVSFSASLRLCARIQSNYFATICTKATKGDWSPAASLPINS